MLARHFPPPAGVQLQGKNATWAAVNTSLPSYPWVHLACHASQDMTDPGRSAFALWDGPLAISDLTRARDGDNLVDRELAYLSACQTAAGDVQLIDEAIHLAAALQLLGYRHVIAAMWSIADQLAPGVTDAIYTAMSAAGHLDTELAAEALHHAIVELRANQPTEPNVWAPYIHTGP